MDLGNGRFDLLLVTDIHGHGIAVVGTDRIDCFLQGTEPATKDNNHFCAVCCQAFGHGSADATATAGHDGNSALKSFAHK